MWRAYKKEFDTPFYFIDFIEVSCKRLHPSYDFLHENYVKKGLKISEIVAQSVFSRTTIVKYIVLYNLQRKAQRTHESNMSIDFVLHSHGMGFSTRRIADLLNNSGIPTLSGKGKWSFSCVAKVIRRVK